MSNKLTIDLENPINDFDREIWYEELEDFVPAKIFDAHSHLWHNRYANGKPTTGRGSACLRRANGGKAPTDLPKYLRIAVRRKSK